MTETNDGKSDRTIRHRERMERKKAVVDEKIARADQDKGLILVHTGNGKGKSSSGFGMVARALGHNMQVGIVQFIKGSYSTGEEAFSVVSLRCNIMSWAKASPGRHRIAIGIPKWRFTRGKKPGR